MRSYIEELNLKEKLAFELIKGAMPPEVEILTVRPPVIRKYLGIAEVILRTYEEDRDKDSEYRLKNYKGELVNSKGELIDEDGEPIND